MLSLQWKTTVE